MSVESILKQKGTDVTTITPGATIKRAADWLRVKNIGCLGDGWGASSWSHFRTGDRSRVFTLWRGRRSNASEGNYATRRDHGVPRREH